MTELWIVWVKFLVPSRTWSLNFRLNCDKCSCLNFYKWFLSLSWTFILWDLQWKHLRFSNADIFMKKFLVERTSATSRFINRSNIWRNFITLEKNWLGFNCSMYLLKYFKYKSVHEGHSKLSNLGIILKGKCEPWLFNLCRIIDLKS